MIAAILSKIQLIATIALVLGFTGSATMCVYQRDRANDLSTKLQTTRETLDRQTDTIVESLERIGQQEKRGEEAVDRLNKFLLQQSISAQQNALAAEEQERKDLESGKNKTFDSRFVR